MSSIFDDPGVPSRREVAEAAQQSLLLHEQKQALMECEAQGCAPGRNGGVADMSALGDQKEFLRKELQRAREARRLAETINHPPHYNHGQFETIDVIEDWQLDFHLGNAVKYISRAGHKGDAVTDIRKARWYLDRWLLGRNVEVAE